MSPRRRLAPACAALAAAAVALAWTFWPAQATGPGPGAAVIEDVPTDPISERTAAVVRVVLHKSQFIDALLAGRLGLAEAVERVLAAEAEEPLAYEEARRLWGWLYPGCPEREAVARNLVLSAAARVTDPAERQAAADRFGRELDAYLRGAGPAHPSGLSAHGPGAYGPPIGRSPS
jgi:hypothetical protein